MHPAVCVALALAAIAGAGCRPPCMDPSFVRSATGSSAYVISASTTQGDVRESGLGPERVTMKHYDAFRCDASRPPTPQEQLFTVELGPRCRLMLRPSTHLRARKRRRGPSSFIVSEAHVIGDQRCTLALDQKTASGVVRSGVLVIRPSSASLEMAVDVEAWNGATATHGKMRLTMSGAWSR